MQSSSCIIPHKLPPPGHAIASAAPAASSKSPLRSSWPCAGHLSVIARFQHLRNRGYAPSLVSNTGMRFILRAIILVASFSSVAIAQTTPKPAVQVELNPQKPLHLRVTLRSGAATTATFYRADLPWGNRYSMVFVVARPNGNPIDLQLPVDDPGPTKVSFSVNAVLPHSWCTIGTIVKLPGWSYRRE
jgi:hypothetical protein